MLNRLLSFGLTLVLILAVADTGRSDEPIGLLVTPADIQQRHDDSGLRILDVRSQQEFEAGHIPGAVSVSVGTWKMQSLSDGGLTNNDLWSRQIGGLGIDNDTSVVVYGGSPTDATRVWWTLKYVGVEHAGILDGGIVGWRDAGSPVDRGAVQIAATDFQPKFQADRLAGIDEVLTVLQDKSAKVIDTRSEGEYAGTGRRGPRQGHIPGAIHQEWTNFVTAEGRFKPVAEIRELLKQQGLTLQTKAITHCQTGGRASLNAFAMELAGFGPVKNYYCGWSQWSGEMNAPVEKP